MQGKENPTPPPGAIPEGYHEVLHWTLKEKSIALQVLSIPFFILSALIFFGLAVSIGKLPSSFTFGAGELGSVIASIPLTIVLHEIVHGMAMKMFGAQPRYGVLWKQAAFYATSPEYAFRRNDYIQIALAPLIVISVLVVLGMWLAHGTFFVVVFALCGIINTSGAIGDLWLTTLALRYDRTAYIIDEKDGVRVFLQRK